MNRWLRLGSILIYGILIVFFAAIVWTIFQDSLVTFRIVARTEFLQVTSSSIKNNLIALTDASINEMESFTGICEVKPGTEIQIRRISRGSMKFTLSSHFEDSVIADLKDVQGKYIRQLSGYAVITISDIDARIDEGKSVVFILRGNAKIGKLISPVFDLGQSYTMIRSGTVTMIAKTFLANKHYVAGMQEIIPGEVISVVDATGSPRNLTGSVTILCDDKTGFLAIYSALGTYAAVGAFWKSGYTIDLSYWQKLMRDEILQAIWLASFFIAGLCGSWYKWKKKKLLMLSHKRENKRIRLSWYD